MLNKLQQQIFDNPQSSEIQQVYADWLEERCEPKHVLYHWLGETKRTPIVGPLNYYYWFREGQCSLINHTLPSPIFDCLAKKNNVWRYTDPEDAENKLFEAYQYATRKGIFWQWKPEHPKQWFHTDINSYPLYIMDSVYVDYNYIDELQDITIDKALDRIIHQRHTGSLFFKTLLGSHSIATCDVDAPIDEVNSTRKWAENNEIGYLEIESSPGHRWFVLDFITKRVSDSLILLQNLIDNDPKYVRICSLRDDYTLRAELRNDFIPTIIKNTLTSNNLSSWVKQWTNYWQDPRVKEISRYRKLNNSGA